MSELPSGTVTFMFTDLVDSTRLWDQHPELMRASLAEHDDLLRMAVVNHSGHVVKTAGDGLHAVFATARDALVAATAMQSSLPRASADGPALSMRVGIHSGEAEVRGGDYYGTAVNRAARIAAAAHGGQILCSGTTAELVQDQVIEPLRLVDLGVHRLRGLTRPDHLWQVLVPGLRERFPPLRTDNDAPGNLPTFLDAFIGREESLRDVVELFDDARLVTLVGVGGVGKTRLAVHTASVLTDRFPDGTWFVELGPIGDPSLVTHEIARVLGVTEKPGQALLDVLVDVLSDRRALLIIDNCEHVLDSAARTIEALLARVNTLSVLATSREGLMIRGERLWPVPSVAPDDAARLFASRASAVRSDFAITTDNADAISTICTRLDGIPLAIELAASRVASMTPHDIANRLDERFRLLTGGNRTALERHQTLRRAVDWSYDLLDPREQQIFVRMSVFVGSCTLEAAAAVTTDDTIDEVGVADALAALAARSLVVVDESGPTARYRMLETLRAFGRELLDAGNEPDAWRARHAEYYAGLAEQIDLGVKGPDEVRWVARMDAEQDDLRAALRWTLDSQRVELALRIITSLAWPWWARGAVSEAERAAAAVMEVVGSRRIDLQARLVSDWALIAQQEVDWEAVTVRSRRAIELTEQSGAALARPYALLGMIESFLGHREEALALTERARTIADAQDDKWEWGYAMSCSVHAFSAVGDYDAAILLADVLLERVREVGNPTRIADALLARALAIAPSDPRGACLALVESADRFESVGNIPMGGAMVSNGVQLALRIGDVALAASFVCRRVAAIQRARDYSFDAFLPNFALHASALLYAAGLRRDAAVLFGAADARMTRSSDRVVILPGARVENEAELRDALLTDEFRDAVERGRALDRDEVLEFVDTSVSALVPGDLDVSVEELAVEG